MLLLVLTWCMILVVVLLTKIALQHSIVDGETVVLSLRSSGLGEAAPQKDQSFHAPVDRRQDRDKSERKLDETLAHASDLVCQLLEHHLRDLGTTTKEATQAELDAAMQKVRAHTMEDLELSERGVNLQVHTYIAYTTVFSSLYTGHIPNEVKPWS